ncbi:uracil-DNA glycosylase [Paenibacillus radicis (ex Gao et al. 2016)]|uniref:Uracil-DNA glycosylase n=1 Tax=Paenibacillus radicis (ex Gao et al. 2016) TaxID=1737354 RepID=A0A917HTR7_9BACL|nr:uracil-DNA glycosylase [Paenibacillus radicis (ex Gao et al. 2016)]GGG90137.1 uracil-DNA glycosylase [Paenibacillus radicis (ex Gao et al. 2016)]
MELNNDWAELLKNEQEQPYYKKLEAFLNERYALANVYPERSELFTALQYTSLAETKVVILGQDPYHGEGQAQGLSFSVKPGVAIPPSLRNIYKELHDDIGCPIPSHGSLLSWAKQGVLLLNTVLSVEEGLPNSHKRAGWEHFTDRIIALLNERERPVVFLLWGKHAQDKASFINTDKHPVIATVHPSPLAARKGFFGSKPFSRANEYLRAIGSDEVDWTID